MKELLGERQVRTHLPPRRGNLRLVGPDRDESIRRIAGQKPEKHEKNDAGDQQREDQDGEPPKNVSEDSSLLPRLAFVGYCARFTMSYAKNCEFSPLTGYPLTEALDTTICG